jgi:hypothetical protein
VACLGNDARDAGHGPSCSRHGGRPTEGGVPFPKVDASFLEQGPPCRWNGARPRWNGAQAPYAFAARSFLSSVTSNIVS